MGIFENWVRVLIFVKIISKFWLGWVPFAVFVFVLAPCGKLNMFWGKFHHVHAFFISVEHCCMLGVWQNVLVTFLCWIGLKWVPLLGITLDWTSSTCFGQWMCVLHTLPKLCLNAMPCTHYAHTWHPLGTPHAPPAALTCISTCTTQTHTCTVMYFMHYASVYMF